MDYSRTLTYDADPDAVFAMLCDKAWREDVCAAMQAASWEVSIVTKGDEVVVQTVRVVRAALPDMFRSMVGDTIALEQTERWGAPHPDGSRSADLRLSVKGQPASMQGSILLSRAGSCSTEIVTGEIKVKIPLLGRRIEPELATGIGYALDQEQERGAAYLTARRS
ncbi:MAG: DUF2505 domain-containing protein [Nocardioidaceae bacterium]